MKITTLHGWDLSLDEARRLQERLAAQVSGQDELPVLRLVAGVDVSAGRGLKTGMAAVVVLSYPELELVEVEVARGELGYPYIPGFLSFREMPLALKAFEKLSLSPDLVIVDGQGIAHPRRLGIASHLGLFLNKPTIGCAKSRLLGNYEMPPDVPGSYTPVVDGEEVIAAALRTRLHVKPVFVSTGHKVSLKEATRRVLSCCRGYRLPEPTRLAHLAAGGNFRSYPEIGFISLGARLIQSHGDKFLDKL